MHTLMAPMFSPQYSLDSAHANKSTEYVCTVCPDGLVVDAKYGHLYYVSPLKFQLQFIDANLKTKRTPESFLHAMMS